MSGTPRVLWLLRFTIHGRPQQWERYASSEDEAMDSAAEAIHREWPDAGPVEIACMPSARAP